MPGAVSGAPNVRIRIIDDELSARGPALTEHITTFEVRVMYRATTIGSESDLEDVMGYAGEIVDIIDANRKLKSNYVTGCEITNISYSAAARDRQTNTVMKYAYMTILVQHLRNTR